MGKNFTGRATQARNVAWGAATGVTIQRHWQETHDIRTTAHAGIRGAIRWYVFTSACWFYIFLFLYQLAIPVVMGLVVWYSRDAQTWETYDPNMVPSQGDTIITLVYWTVVWMMGWLVFPYSLGVLWVRFSDRSLMRVHRWGLYRKLLPFAYQMRNRSDVTILFLSVAAAFVSGCLSASLGSSLVTPRLWML